MPVTDHFSVYISLHSHTTALVKCKLVVPCNLNDTPLSVFKIKTRPPKLDIFILESIENQVSSFQSRPSQDFL